LNWDLNTHRSTQQLIGWIGTSTRSTQRTSKGSIWSDWDVDPGFHNSCSAVDTSHHPPPRTKPLFSPAQRETAAYFFLKEKKKTLTQHHTEEEAQQTNRANTETPPPKKPLPTKVVFSHH
jgi:hypothetical protein